jgi:subtilisin family serine protease
MYCSRTILLFLLTLCPFSALAQGPSGLHFVPGEVLVKFRSDDVSNKRAASLHLYSTGPTVKRFPIAKNLERVKLAPDITVEDAVGAYNQLPEVQYAEPNYIRRAFLKPSDPSFFKLWGLHNTRQTGGKGDADIDGPEAWNTQTGSSNVVIAVMDTGADWDHEDLSSNIWTNSYETEDGVDGDGNGYIDDLIGWDFVNDDNDPYDDDVEQYHGTHVSGTIAAVGDNGVGVVGVNWSASIMVLKILGAGGQGSVAEEIAAIDYAIQNGARIINASLGGSGYSSAEYDAITRARDAGILFVAAAGNDGWDTDVIPTYPACHDLDNIIAVAATDENDRLASFSNYGATSADVAAPGVSIYSTRGENSYQYLSGTSMAAPHVSGLAALIWADDDASTWSEVKARILTNVDVKIALEGKILTGGRINANRSLSTSPHIDKVKPASCGPGKLIRIIGYHFGDQQGSSIIHIGKKAFGITSPRVKLWTDIEIRIRILKYNCDWFKGQGSQWRKVWVNCGAMNSNKKRLIVNKPATCP